MKDHDVFIRNIVANYQTVKSPVFNSIRLLILLLHYIYTDGIQFRELQAVLGISDGKLLADLGILLKSSYLQKHKTKLDNKELEFYTLSPKGKNEIEGLKQLFNFKEVTAQNE